MGRTARGGAFPSGRSVVRNSAAALARRGRIRDPRQLVHRRRRYRVALMGTRLKAGFTLIEALVALALVLAFASVLGPYLFQARRIVANVDGRVAAQVLLRTLLDAPFDRTRLANAVREGEVSGLRWRIVTAPIEGATTT